MDGSVFDKSYAKGLPDPTPRFTGFPKYNFIGGHNDPTLIPIEGLSEATESVLRRDGDKLALYNLGQGPQGYLGLREFVARKLGELRGIKTGADEVLITTGSGQGIDIVNRMLLERGDTVLLEEYSYGGAITKLKKLGVNIVGMKLDEQGIRPDALAATLGELKAKGITPKYIYTIPTIQNPTGSILPLDRRHALLRLAREYGVPVFEDECYADLLWAGVKAPPALYALDPEQVVHIGSFSKTLAPALRVGYATARWPVLSRMLSCKTDSGTGALDQMIVAEYFARHFEKHVTQLCGRLHEKLAVMQEALEREFGAAVETWRPEGGIFLWMKLPDRVDVRKLVKPAADAGIAFNPGPEWAVDPEASKSHLRLCFALPSKEQIREGVAAFARVCWKETGIPEQSGNVRHAD
ncbi:MAG TPA: PLP-dependent aminotransferase family protein [Acetobacteraceae bacterium]|nr:PLP-dependent aminotransferase family protein [Acetobacteraceae bacterium]